MATIIFGDRVVDVDGCKTIDKHNPRPGREEWWLSLWEEDDEELLVTLDGTLILGTGDYPGNILDRQYPDHVRGHGDGLGKGIAAIILSPEEAIEWATSRGLDAKKIAQR